MNTVAEKLLKFEDAPAAVSWAEEVLASSNVRSQLARMMRVPGASEFTRDELRDQALLISTCLEKTDPRPAGWMFGYVYGIDDGNRQLLLLDALARDALRRKEAEGKPHILLSNVLVDVLRGHRRYIIYNKPTAKSRFAEIVGEERRSFHDTDWWKLVIAERAYLDLLLRVAEKQVSEILTDKGFIV